MNRVALYQALYSLIMAAHTPEQFLQTGKVIKAHRTELGAIETDDLLRIKANRYNDINGRAR